MQNELSLHIDSQSLSIEQFNVFVEKYLEPENTQNISYAPDAPDAPDAQLSQVYVCNVHKWHLNQDRQNDPGPYQSYVNSESSFDNASRAEETRL